MAKARDNLLGEVFSRLESDHGRTVVPPSEHSALEAAIFLIVATRHGHDAAERTFRALKSDFVDWNEVRVSSVREIALSVKVRDVAARSARADEIRGFLTSLFERQSRVDLGFVAEAGFEDAATELAGYEGLAPGIAAQIALHAVAEEGVQTSATLLRVARRLGLVEKRATPTKARSRLDGLVGGDDRHRLHRALLELGHTVCLAKTTRCDECFVGSACPSSKPKGAGRAAAGKKKATSKKATSEKATSKKAAPSTAGQAASRRKKGAAAKASRASSSGAAKKSGAGSGARKRAENNGTAKKPRAKATSRSPKSSTKSPTRKKK